MLGVKHAARFANGAKPFNHPINNRFRGPGSALAAFMVYAPVLLALTTAPSMAGEEPNVKVASAWWPELTNVATPVAWRDHPHRFSVVYDGTLLALPHPQTMAEHDYAHGTQLEGTQLSFYPSADGVVPPQPAEEYGLTLPNGKRIGDQGWVADRAAPVLWTRWRADVGAPNDVVLRQLVFAHLYGGGETFTGQEPMFAWIRLEVAEVTAAAAAPASNCPQMSVVPE
jgi:hypothetical protein